jgi:hypothetical protein
MPVGVVVEQRRESDLTKVATAQAMPRLLSRGLHRREQQRDQDADDGNYRQQLDEGEGATPLACGHF